MSKEKSRTEYSILNIFAGLVGYFLNTVLGFICRMVFVRCLAADYLGVNGLFSNILTMLSLAELGVGSAVVYALYKPLAEHDEKKIASLMQLYGKAYRTIGLVIGVVGLCLTPFLNLIITEPPNIVESIYLLYFINLFNTTITYFYSYRSSLIIAAQQNYIVSGISYLVTILQSIFQIIALLNTHNYLWYLGIQTIGILIYNITISYIAGVKFPYIKDKNVDPLPEAERKTLFQNVRDLMYYKISGLMVNSTDNILITFFRGLATTGIASNYTMIVNTIGTLLGQIFNGLTASVGNHNALETNDSKFQMFSFLNLMNFWMFGWAALGVITCSSDVVRLCFGENYVLSIQIPMVIALNFYSYGMMNAIWTYKHTMGLFHYGRFMQLFTGTLNIIFSVILGKAWGLFGILFATFIARACTSFWYDPYAVFKYGFGKKVNIYLKRYFLYIVVLICTWCVVKVSFIPFQSISNLFIKVLVEMLVCSLVVNLIFITVFYRFPEFEKCKEIGRRSLKIIMRKK